MRTTTEERIQLLKAISKADNAAASTCMPPNTDVGVVVTTDLARRLVEDAQELYNAVAAAELQALEAHDIGG